MEYRFNGVLNVVIAELIICILIIQELTTSFDLHEISPILAVQLIPLIQHVIDVCIAFNRTLIIFYWGGSLRLIPLCQFIRSSSIFFRRISFPSRFLSSNYFCNLNFIPLSEFSLLPFMIYKFLRIWNQFLEASICVIFRTQRS